MKIWKDTSGKWITPQEFRQRFSEGVQGITPLQQKKSQLFFTWLVILGLICGIVVSIYSWKTLWWLAIVLIAGLGNTCVGLIGAYQQYKILKNMDSIIQGSSDEQELFSSLKGGNQDNSDVNKLVKEEQKSTA